MIESIIYKDMMPKVRVLLFSFLFFTDENSVVSIDFEEFFSLEIENE